MLNSGGNVCVKAKRKISAEADGTGFDMLLNEDGGRENGRGWIRKRRKGGEAMKAVKVNQNLLKALGKEGKAMRVGDIVRIKKCDPMPEVVGETAEIVDLQMQEFEKYRAYPVWVKMTSGERKGKVCGFHYDEVEVLPGKAKTAVVEQVEEILKGVSTVEDIAEIERVTKDLAGGGRIMRVGDTVRIKKCDPLLEVVGETAKIADLQMQEFEEYRTYPIWVKMTSGERKGKVYGFQHDEIEILPKVHGVRTAGSKIIGGAGSVKSKVARQLEEILKGVDTMEDIVEIERAVNEVKGKILLEPALGFWEGKTPCWEMLRCPEAIRNECPAFKYRELPCWQIEGTYTKLHGYGQEGDNTDVCRVCRVYKRWGQNEPIEIKLRGKGFNQALKAEAK